GERIARVREGGRLGDRGGGRDAAGVRVLDDGDRGAGVVERGAQGGIRVDVVVVRHLLALQLRRLRDAGAAGVAVEGGALVGVLAVAQHLGAGPRGARPAGEPGAVVVGGEHVADPARDGDVV